MEERVDDVINNDGKRVKATKNTSACDVCRDRKKKCDGKAPCSYCVVNNKSCQFSQRRKRGPKFKAIPNTNQANTHYDFQINNRSVMANTINNSNNNININNNNTRTNSMAIFNPATSRYECEIIDKLESGTFKEFYLMFVNPYMHLNPEDIMSPVTVAHRVQAYAALAIASRLCGNRSKAQTYMSHARALAGSVFDSPNADTVAAMLMLGQFCRLTLDVSLYKYYIHLAYGLTKVGPMRIQGKLGVACEIYNILQKEELTMRQKAAMVKQAAAPLASTRDVGDHIFMLMYENAANMLGTCNINAIQPDLNSLQNCFYLLQNVNISPEERTAMLQVIDSLKVAMNNSLARDMKVVYINNFYHPIYSALVEWRSGHHAEALDHALHCLHNLQKLDDAGFLVIVAKPTHIALMGSLASLFLSLHLFSFAEQMCDNIKHICQVLSPEYDFLRLRVDEYVSMNLTNHTSPPATSFPSNPSLPLPNTSVTSLYQQNNPSFSSSSSSPSPSLQQNDPSSQQTPSPPQQNNDSLSSLPPSPPLSSNPSSSPSSSYPYLLTNELEGWEGGGGEGGEGGGGGGGGGEGGGGGGMGGEGEDMWVNVMFS